MNPALLSSNSDDWCTPECVLELVRKMGPIGLDPCSNADSIVGAETEWRHERDGDSLLKSWSGFGLVFVNHPYSAAIQWLSKMCIEGAAGTEIVCLMPARTDTKWFQRAWQASAICFWRGRLKFLGAKSSAPFPSALVYWGPRAELFEEIFGEVGKVVLL